MAPDTRPTTYDITLPVVPDLCVWPGDPRVEIAPDARIEEGDGCNTSRLAFGSHTGTHVDAPWHFFQDGAKLDEIPLDRFIGPCYVAEIPHEVRRIMPDHLDAAAIPGDTRRLLLKTANSAFWDRPHPWHFDPSYAGLGAEAAEWVVSRGIGLVGVDYLSIEPYGEDGHPAHHRLLGNGVLIIEGLDLRHVQSGAYHLTCLPLRLLRGDGAPARAILTALP
jgi:arylformamidase